MGVSKLLVLMASVALLSAGCGSSGTLAPDDSPVNTAKLAGTPFEGATKGDAIGWDDLRSGSYLTYKIDSTPIPVFLAYFSASEETEIKEGVVMANNSVGFEVFSVTDAWDNSARVIYKVDAIGDAESGFGEEFFTENPAVTLTSRLLFNGKNYAETVVADWLVELRDDGVDRWIVAHELGHAMGIDHFLINYDNDTIGALEPDSIMSGDIFPFDPQMTDYNFMMQKQGEILNDHLGEGSPPPEASISF